MLYHTMIVSLGLAVAISAAKADNYELIALRAANPNPNLVINEVLLVDHKNSKVYNCRWTGSGKSM